MEKANGIMVNKDNDYKYIYTFIDFLEKIINIIMGVFERLGISLGKKASGTDAVASNGDA